MITKLNYALTFTKGNPISRNLTLGPGSTLITGLNGRGKSLNFEMVGFALFGTAALRGVATDYKKISVELDVTIKGTPYTITRTKSKAEVSTAGEPICSGTKAVNLWAVRTLGYNYDVFRISNLCAQGDIQALANMRPTDRKAMIDSVAGLTQMDVLTDKIAGDIRESKARIEEVERGLVHPVAPELPQIPREEIAKRLTEFQTLQQEWQTLAAMVAPVEPTLPIEPAKPELPQRPVLYQVTKTAPVAPENTLPENWKAREAELVAAIQTGRTLEAKYLSLQTQYAAVEFPKGYPSRESVVEAWQNWAKRERLNALLAHQTLECPHCNKHFHLQNAEIEALQALDLPEAPPAISVADFDQLVRQDGINQELSQVESQYQALDLPGLIEEHGKLLDAKVVQSRYCEDLSAYQQHAAQVAASNQQAEATWQRNCDSLLAQYNNAKALYDSQMANLEADRKRYGEALAAYQKGLERKTALQEQYGAGAGVAATLREIITALNEAQSTWAVYDSLKAQYDAAVKTYEVKVAALTEAKAQQEERTNARAAIKKVKERVQTYLLPSLNKVASYLMAEMTGGELNSVEVLSDFEVVVDGQPLRTLSGSGKDIANLALRIGLGRILTHKVLPVMMLDEIDAAMDDNRARYTWACIQKITPQIGQVLQASHKELAAESRVEV